MAILLHLGALDSRGPQPLLTFGEYGTMGKGIGNNVAHEIAHQLVKGLSASGKMVSNMDLHDGSVGTLQLRILQRSRRPLGIHVICTR